MPDEGPQLPLLAPRVPLDGLAELPPESVNREGGSRPLLFLMASDMNDYLCKGPSLIPQHPYIGANEWIVANLARAMGIPARPCEIVRWQGQLFFASQLLPNGRKMTGLISQNWSRLANAPSIAYPVVTLDVWTLNVDRHEQNWLGGVLSTELGTFMVSDHDLAILAPGREPEGLAQLTGSPVEEVFVRSATLRGAIQSRAALEEAIRAAEAVTDAQIQMIVAQVPHEWLGPHQKAQVSAFLGGRRDRLRDIFAQPGSVFPALEGTT